MDSRRINLMCAGALAMAFSANIARLSAAETESLAQYRWQNRLLLVFAPSATSPDVHTLEALLHESSCELLDRDIVVGWLFSNGSARVGDQSLSSGAAETLRGSAKVDPGTTTMILVGKDGGEKARYDTQIDLEKMFALIDGMPMRRSEMLSRPTACSTKSW